MLPRYVETVWERGRYIEYLFAFTFFKPVEDCFGKPLISSGCFSAYKTDIVRQLGGWSDRTLAEDMDLTWSLYRTGHRVRFVPDAICYPIEPRNFHFLSGQLRRWSHGFVQNLRLHWRCILSVPYLRSMVLVGVWDATVGSLLLLFVMPLLAILVNPLFLLGYLIDLPAIAVPAIANGWQRGEICKVLVRA